MLDLMYVMIILVLDDAIIFYASCAISCEFTCAFHNCIWFHNLGNHIGYIVHGKFKW